MALVSKINQLNLKAKLSSAMYLEGEDNIYLHPKQDSLIFLKHNIVYKLYIKCQN